LIQSTLHTFHPPLIQGLRADLIPHCRWALQRWFYRTSLWYYHAPSPKPQLKANSRFFELVDPELKEPCRILLENGIQTTPSCQGHFYKRSRFERIWRDLVRDSFRIAERGLTVRDSETDKIFLFRDRFFELPWRSFGQFYSEAASQQSRGYLGMLIPFDRPMLARRFDADRYRSHAARIKFDRFLSERLDAWVFGIHVWPHSPRHRRHEWRRVSQYIADRLREMR
jgi:hypothetical protein